MSTFPIDLMPPKAKEAITAQAALGNYPVESVATAAMAIMSFAAQGLRNVVDPSQEGHCYPLSQLYMVLAGSGDAKSSVYRNLMAGVNRWQEAGEKQYEDAMALYAIDKALHDRQVKKAERDPANARALLHALSKSVPRRPRSRRNTGSKITTNAIIKTLDEGWSTYGLFSDEGGSILGGHSLKAENSPVEFASALTMLWDRGAADRATGEITVTLRGRRFSGLIMVQPTVARDFLQNRTFAEQGIHARFNIVQSAKWQPLAEDHTDPAVLARRRNLKSRVVGFNNRIEELLSEALPFAPNSDCVLDPLPLDWSHEASKEAVSLIKSWVEARGDRTETFWFRFWEHVCRTAGVLAVFEGEEVITLPILKAAWALALFYADQWTNLDLEVGNERDTKDAPYVEKILKALKARGPMTDRDLARGVVQRLDSDVRRRVLTHMVNDERLTVTEVVNGTRKTLMYAVAA